MKKKYVGILCVILVGTIALERSTNVAMSPNDYVSLGNQMGMAGDHVGASKFFKNAMRVDPYYVPAYLGLGIAYGNLGKDEDAIEVFKEGIKLDNAHNFIQCNCIFRNYTSVGVNSHFCRIKIITPGINKNTDK